MTEHKKIPLEELINNIDDYYQIGILYTKNRKIELNQPVLISFNIYSDASIDQYMWTLPCSDIKDIIVNLKEEIRKPSIEDCAKAINFYIQNDAFVDSGELR